MLLVISRSIHCFTLNLCKRAESDFEQQKREQTNHDSRISTKGHTNATFKTDSAAKGNQQSENLTQSELGSQIQENNKR